MQRTFVRYDRGSDRGLACSIASMGLAHDITRPASVCVRQSNHRVYIFCKHVMGWQSRAQQASPQNFPCNIPCSRPIPCLARTMPQLEGKNISSSRTHTHAFHLLAIGVCLCTVRSPYSTLCRRLLGSAIESVLLLHPGGELDG